MYGEDKAAEMKELTEQLEEGVRKFISSDHYKEYLDTMRKFHNYSFNNIILILSQMPEATRVAGFVSWKRDFHRHVKKGERGIRIIAPAPRKVKREQNAFDVLTGKPVLDALGNPKKETVEVTIPYFKAATVFDVSQTTGAPLPELEVAELDGEVKDYAKFLDAVCRISPVPIRFDNVEGGAKGYFSRQNQEIVINHGMSEMQTMKTLIHELAHSVLHNTEVPNEMSDRHTKEVEAESVAYTVCAHFGLDTSDYSFAYVGTWSEGKDTSILRGSMEKIRTTAAELIGKIEEQMREKDPREGELAPKKKAREEAFSR